MVEHYKIETRYMQKDSKNKMVTGDARTAFITTKKKQGFSGDEIVLLLKKEGFRPVHRSRIYKILRAQGNK